MKYIIVLGDGMADYNKGPLGVKTPLKVAKKPNMNRLAAMGTVGRVRTIDEGMPAGSDVANLSVLGYEPQNCYTGRAPLEALSLGINLGENDTAFRMNFVTLSDEENFADKKMLDYSAGELSTEEDQELIEVIKRELGDGCLEYFAGTSYRNCAVLRGARADVQLTAPHDIHGQKIEVHLPHGEGAEVITSIMRRSYEVLKNHPINLKRIEEGKNPANAVWFWGLGTKPELQPFYEKFGMKGAMISAVDLLKGIAVGAQMEVVEVEGATGNLDTDFMSKADACLKALENNDYVYLHFEAPDECGHQGDAAGKIKAIEKIDEVVGYIVKNLEEKGTEFVMAILPDHPTPLVLRTHVADPVPFIVYNSVRHADCGMGYDEDIAQTGIYLSNARALFRLMKKS